MKCPFCGHEDTQVKDSRPSEDGQSIRRRRFCPSCQSRFTTFERVQLRELFILKKDGSRKPFDRDKLTRSIDIAVRKRNITPEQVDLLVNNIVRRLESLDESEVTTERVGEEVMLSLAALDNVAFIRFASVYKAFKEASDFAKFIETISHK